MNNYSELSNEELNKLAGEKIMGWKLMLVADDSGVLYDGAEFENYVADNGEGCGMFSPDDWNPCDKDSAQAERYLFAKLIELGCQIKEERQRNYDFGIDHYKLKIVRQEELGEVTYCRVLNSEGFDKINRTRVIYCLEVMDKL